MTQAILWYFADPMCSWCWGFSPIITQIKNDYHDKLQIALNLGGLRPETTKAISTKDRDEVLHHWQDVQKISGQEFNFDNALADDFIYNTEPASRALVTFGKLDSENTLALFHDIQYAFYVSQKDVTQQSILLELAKKYTIDESEFISIFESQETKDQTKQHFANSRSAGVLGFPTLVFQHGKNHQFLSRGYASFEIIQQQLDTLLNEVD
ncbi:Thioredoxin [hydrothermal vent metagenome]|uniref:Thioredoxin n=1 Tax=hydrothermal vent metagenome TaxID=652676 RepID=A0A3B1AP32_9ZZZZ